MTCRICGHHQNGGCCQRCHEAHRNLWEQAATTGRQQDRIQARRILAGLEGDDQ